MSVGFDSLTSADSDITDLIITRLKGKFDVTEAEVHCVHPHWLLKFPQMKLIYR